MNKVQIEAVSRLRNMGRRDPELNSVIWRTVVDYGHVICLESPTGEYTTNNFALPITSRFRRPDIIDAVEADENRAKKLNDFFGGIQRGHQLECHDLIQAIASVDPLVEVSWNAVSSAEQIDSGNTYGVFINRSASPNRNWQLTHSCIGTDNQNLLGVNGSGGELMLTSFDVTKRLFSYGSSQVVLAALEQ